MVISQILLELGEPGGRSVRTSQVLRNLRRQHANIKFALPDYKQNRDFQGNLEFSGAPPLRFWIAPPAPLFKHLRYV
jgi:hypothetical protein